MENSKYFHLFIKFGEEEFMKKLLEGEVFFNTLEYYRKHENKEIGDPLEGTTYMSNIGNAILSFDNKKFRVENVRLSGVIA